ncbi:MAG TPA: hypothetical protein DD377_00490 [Firmicutes bacterium]|nr:hypothetical protein [Bacillota bacterium]
MPKNYKWYVYAPLNEKRWADIRKKENREEFINAVKEMSRIANQRLNQLRKNEWTKRSPAYMAWEKHGLGTFGNVNYDDYTEIVKEYARVSDFLRRKTTTVKATKKYITKIEKEFNIDFKSPDDYDMFWDVFSKFEEQFKEFEAFIYRGTMISELADIYATDNSIDNALSKLTNRYLEMRGKTQSAYESIPDVQEFNEMFQEDDGGFTF